MDDGGVVAGRSPSHPSAGRVKHSILALHEPQTPVWWHDWATNDAGELVEHVHGAGAQQEVEVQDATDGPVLQRAAGDGNLHAVAVHEHHSMGQAACRHHHSLNDCSNKYSPATPAGVGACHGLPQVGRCQMPQHEACMH